MSRLPVWVVRVACALAMTLPVPPAFAVSPDLVISQVYGGGGNSGATLKNDFIEIFNRGASPVNVTGWSVQYASTAGFTWAATALSGTIPPGGYYLVREAAGTGGTVDLPTPDAPGSINMASRQRQSCVGDKHDAADMRKRRRQLFSEREYS